MLIKINKFYDIKNLYAIFQKDNNNNTFSNVFFPMTHFEILNKKNIYF